MIVLGDWDLLEAMFFAIRPSLVAVLRSPKYLPNRGQLEGAQSDCSPSF